MLQYIKQRVRQYIDYTIDKKIDEKFPIYQQIYEFRNAPDDMLSSKVEAKTIISNLAERLEAIVTVTKTIIDISEFEVWLKEYPEVVSYYDKLGDVKIEKLLEHYLTSKHLDAGRGVYIDIAASGSPFSDAVGQHTGCKAYCQDLVFEKGIHGNRIGGDAGEMPVPDDFADVMALHCAFECFQGDADIRFVKEAGRVLKNGGRFGIIPLYLDDIYFVKTGPKYDKRKVSVEPEAKWIWRDDQWDTEPFSRHYSPEVFKRRIIDTLTNNMTAEIIYFTNVEELRSYYAGSRIYCNFMFKAAKGK